MKKGVTLFRCRNWSSSSWSTEVSCWGGLQPCPLPLASWRVSAPWWLFQASLSFPPSLLEDNLASSPISRGSFEQCRELPPPSPHPNMSSPGPPACHGLGLPVVPLSETTSFLLGGFQKLPLHWPFPFSPPACHSYISTPMPWPHSPWTTVPFLSFHL